MEEEYRMQKAKEEERKTSFSHEEGSTDDAAVAADDVAEKLEDVSLTDDAEPAIPSIKIDRTSLERPPQSAEEDPKVKLKGKEHCFRH
jgi:hypothetical protein